MREISAQDAMQTRLCKAPGCVEDATHDGRCDACTRAHRQGRFNRLRGRELSRAELVALKLSAEGLSSAQIAKQLGKSEETVKVQRRMVIAKLEAQNITHAASLAYRAGILA